MKTTKLISKTLGAAMVAAALLLGSSAAFAQIKAGDNPTSIKGTALMELESTNKSFYPPRVALTAANVAAPITGLTAADKGATVYNTANAGSGATEVTEGLCTWDGAKWVCMNNTTQSAEVMLHVIASANTTLPFPNSGAFTKINYGTTIFDKNNNFNLATDQFTTPSTGFYLVTVGIQRAGSPAPANSIGTLIFINNVSDPNGSGLWDQGLLANEGFTVSATRLLKLTAGQVVDVRARSNFATDATSTGTGTFLQISKVSN